MRERWRLGETWLHAWPTRNKDPAIAFNQLADGRAGTGAVAIAAADNHTARRAQSLCGLHQAGLWALLQLHHFGWAKNKRMGTKGVAIKGIPYAISRWARHDTKNRREPPIEWVPHGMTFILIQPRFTTP